MFQKFCDCFVALNVIEMIRLPEPNILVKWLAKLFVVQVVKLKDKLGTRQLPTAELLLGKN